MQAINSQLQLSTILTADLSEQVDRQRRRITMCDHQGFHSCLAGDETHAVRV